MSVTVEEQSRLFPVLDQAKEFLASKGHDYMLISHDKIRDGKTNSSKTFQVAHQDLIVHTLLNVSTLSNEHRCLNEVIHGPCKLYIDLDYYKKHNRGCKGADMQTTLVQALRDELYEQFEIEVAGVVVTDASNADKFSRHIVFDMGNAMFESNKHVQAFINQTVRRKQLTLNITTKDGKGTTTIYDQAVYSRNHSLRMIGCIKYNEPERPMKLLSGTLDAATIIKSFITFPRNAETKIISMPEAEVGSKRQRSEMSTSTNSITSSSSADDDVWHLLASLEQLRKYKIQRSRLKVQNEPTLTCIVPTLSHDCPYKGSEHEHNHIYFKVNVQRGTYKCLCYDEECQTAMSNQLPQALSVEDAQRCRTFIQQEWDKNKPCALNLKLFKA